VGLRSVGGWLALSCVFASVVAVSAVSASQLQWTTVQPARAQAIAAHSDGKIYLVVVDKSGHVRFTTTQRPDTWANLQYVGLAHAMGMDPAIHANPATDPVLKTVNGKLVLFVRGKDNNLYVALKVGTGPWAAWQQLTTDGSVRGRISVAFSAFPATPDPFHTHVVYTTENNSVRHIHFVGFDVSTLENCHDWSNAVDAAIASKGTASAVAVVRKGTSLETWTWTYPCVWKQLGARDPTVFCAAIGDLSDVVYFGGSYHFLYAARNASGSHCALAHGRVTETSDSGFVQYVPLGGGGGSLKAVSQIAVYRNKLFGVLRDVDGKVQVAFLDNASPGAPGWIPLGIVGSARGRPALTEFDGRAGLSGTQYLQANYGNDLFAVASHPSTDKAVFVNLSRAAFILRLKQIQLAVRYCTEYGGTWVNADCPAVSGLPASESDLPVFSEVGFGSLVLPNWLMSTIFKRTMATTNTPAAPYVTWIHTQNIGPYIGPNLNIDSTADYFRWWEEMGHRLAGSLGLCDDGFCDTPGSPETNLMEDWIPNSAIADAFTLFARRVRSNRTCVGGADADGRCRGFTGASNNYDVKTRQHSWIYPLLGYFKDGSHLRTQVQDDLAAGDPLLCEKYDWIRDRIFHGVQFDRDAAPDDGFGSQVGKCP